MSSEDKKKSGKESGKEKKPNSKKMTIAPASKKNKTEQPSSELTTANAQIGRTHLAQKKAKTEKQDIAKPDEKNLIERLMDEDNAEDDTPVDPEALERGDQPMTLVEHLSEMRSRLLVILATLLILMLVAFGFSDYLLALISRPFVSSGQKLNLFTLFEGFTLRLKSSLFASVLVTLPLIVYQTWKYIEPAINRNDRTIVRVTLISSIFLFYAGTAFAYFFLPLAIMALMGFAPPDMLITNNATEYFNFFLMTSLILGAIFELPIVILLLTKMGLISPVFLSSKRKYAIVIIWIIAALASPGPDPLSQALLALPLMLLYEISIVISKIIVRGKKKRELARKL